MTPLAFAVLHRVTGINDTPPSAADSHLANLQAANRQLRDDLARAEARARFAEEMVRATAGDVTPSTRTPNVWVWRVDGLSVACLTADQADRLRTILHPDPENP